MSCLQNFKSIKSRGAIQQQMMNKLVDTLEQFLREIIAAQEMFDRCKTNPLLTRNQPPVAGSQPQLTCRFMSVLVPPTAHSHAARLHRCLPIMALKRRKQAINLREWPIRNF